MPYWKELANAIRHWSDYHADDETLEFLIGFIETPDAVLDVLRPVIKRSSVKYVGFISDSTPKTWKLAEFIEDVIQTNHKLTEVGFGQIRLSNEEWIRICSVVKTRSAQQSSIMGHFGLTRCFVVGIDTEVLKGILTCNNIEIHMEFNGMSSREASIIAEFLNSNRPLAHLCLSGNRFGDNDAAVLANALSSDTHLRTIDVEHNNIKDEGRLTFLRAIFDVSSLASCAASNHACRILGLEQDITDLNYDDDIVFNKWEKIFAMLVLSSEDSFINTALLIGVPASLMPVILYRANYQYEEGDSDIADLYLELTGAKRCRKHDVWKNLEHSKSLNCMHELIRSWVVPSIYA